MIPQVTVGVLNQKIYRGVGAGDPLDDCWALADIMGLLACAPWEAIPSVSHYRDAAGNPDEIGVSDGGTLEQSALAVKTLWPKIGAMTEVRKTGVLSASAVVDKIVAGHPVSQSVLSSALPARLQFGFGGTHRCLAVFIANKLRIGNPLAPAFSPFLDITEDELKAAIKAYPANGAGGSIIFPTPDEAFRAHPLLEGAIARALTAAVDKACADAVAKLDTVKKQVTDYTGALVSELSAFQAAVKSS